MNSSSILKRDCVDTGTLYDMPLLKVINRQPPKQERVNEMNVEKSTTDNAKSTFNVYETMESEILADAKKKADEILAEAEIKSQKLYSENYRVAQEKGYIDGSRQAMIQSQNQVNDMMKQLENISNILAEEKNAIINSSKNMIIDLASAIAKKIVNESFTKDNTGVFLAVFQNAVRNIPPAEKLIVTVSNKDYKVMTFDAQKLLELAPGFQNIEIRCDTTADVGTLKLESSIMVVDASVDTQIGLLKKEIYNLL